MPHMNKLGRTATRVFTLNGTTEVIYHDTCVVAFSNKKITLEHGGWRTSTTRTRMNQASNQFDLDYSVFQKNFHWYVSYGGKTYPFDANSPLTLKRTPCSAT